MTLQLAKCTFFSDSVEYLGHIISADGMGPAPSKVAAVQDFAPPTTVTGVRAFLGLAGFYRRFVWAFSVVAEPLIELTRTKAPFVWGPRQQSSFDKLKAALLKAPVLAYPDFDRPFELHVDACKTGGGATLNQTDNDGHMHPVAYWSMTFNKAQRNYGTSEQECLAMVAAIKHFRPYIYGRRVRVITDHKPLEWLASIKEPAGRLTRWAIMLSEYDLEIVHRPGVVNKDADGLSRMTSIWPEDEPSAMEGVGESAMPGPMVAMLTRARAARIRQPDADEDRDRDGTVGGLATMLQGRESGEARLGQQAMVREDGVQHSSQSSHFAARPLEPSAGPVDADPAAATSGYTPWEEYFVLPPARGDHGLTERVSVWEGLDQEQTVKTLVDQQRTDETLASCFRLAEEEATGRYAGKVKDRRWQPFVCSTAGVLYRLGETPELGNHEGVRRILCVPLPLREVLLYMMHDDPLTGGHLSAAKVYNKLRVSYWWPHMYKDVERYCERCGTCAGIKGRKGQAPIQPIPLPKEPWELIGMDSVGPFSSYNEWTRVYSCNS